MVEKTLALDASQRTVDEYGHLRVARTCISKAAVNPYFGREIPGYEELGLEADKIYNLLRDPAELEAAADSFKGKQLLLKHIPVDSDEPQKEFTIGAIGSDIVFDNGSLFADLTVWDGEGKEFIESKKMQELSAGYGYTPDMTPGTFNDERYDGIMRNIRGNHVALVERGRIGRDAVVADSLPFEMGLTMKLKKGALQRITAKLGLDEDTVKKAVEAVDEELEEIVGGEDESPEKPDGGADKPAKDEQTQAERDNESEAERLKDREEREEKDRKRDQAMDADSVIALIEAKYSARDAVEPLVGRIALDGFSDASAIYAYALKQKGIACDGINEAGLKALVSMHRDAPAKVVAMDAAPTNYTKRFKQG